MKHARTIRFGLAGTLLMLPTLGCGPLDQVDGIEERQQNFEFKDPDSFRSRIREFPAGNTFRICLYGTDVTSKNRRAKQTTIRNAAMAWVDAVRPVATSPLITATNITFNTPDAKSGKCTGTWDLDLNWVGDTGRAVANPGLETGVAWMVVYRPDPFQIVLHEFGHVFGLGDTYIEGGGGACKPGQPSAVMCENGHKFKTLQPDDIDGIRAVFRSAFPGMSTLPAHLAWAGSQLIP